MKYRVYENADWRDTLLMCSAKFLLQDDQGSKNAQLQSMCWFTVERGQCIYSCTQAGDLKSKRHKLTNSGEKSFSCKQCEFSCTTGSNLKTLTKTHTGKKSLRCTQCNYSYTQAGDLKKHMLSQKKTSPTAQRATTPARRLVASKCIQEKTFSAAHSVIVQPQQLVASRDTCWSIQKSPSGVNCVTILALELNISSITSSHTLHNALSNEN